MLIDKFGVVKIADFGWAARLEGEYHSSGDRGSKSAVE